MNDREGNTFEANEIENCRGEGIAVLGGSGTQLIDNMMV